MNPDFDRLIQEAGHRILQIADALGAGRKMSRCIAIWRKGKNLSVSLNPVKGVFFDHVDNTGGGVVRFVELCSGLSSQESIKWLSEYTGIGLTQTPQERQQWQSRRVSMESEAEQFYHWRLKRIEQVWRQLYRWCRLYRDCDRMILTYGLDSPRCESAAMNGPDYFEKWQALYPVIDELTNPTDWTALFNEFRTARGQA